MPLLAPRIDDRTGKTCGDTYQQLNRVLTAAMFEESRVRKQEEERRRLLHVRTRR